MLSAGSTATHSSSTVIDGSIIKNMLNLSLNARSLCNRLSSFKSMIAFYKPSIVAVTEIWL